MVPDETSDLPTTLPEASFLNPNRKVPSEAQSLRGLFPVPVFAEFPSYSLSKNADGFLQNPFWLSYCNLRKLKGNLKNREDRQADVGFVMESYYEKDKLLIRITGLRSVERGRMRNV